MNPAMPSRTNSVQDGSNDDEARPYVIGPEIGSGSFATVYKGYHEETHKQVAIKAVKRDKLSAKLFENLQSEIQILKLVSHRHITRLLDIVQSKHNIYLVMEYCSGGDLTHYIKKRGRVETLEYIPNPGAAPQYYPHPRTGGLDEIVIRSFLRQLARALKFLRHNNLIHRDIKPQNLLLNPAPPEELARGHPLGVPILKVADFGFARSLPKTMMAETLCGSPLYMAPEILGSKKYDEKADLWSVGAVLYEISVGKPPFRAQNHIELLRKIEHSKGIKFPDEDPHSSAAKSGGGGSEALPVPNDIKKLIRMLLKQKPFERASFDQFFGSTAVAKSKFPRPKEDSPSQVASTMSGVTSAEASTTVQDGEQPSTWPRRPVTPEAHKVIPPEVLDEKAMIPPSKFNFRRPSTNGESGGTPPTNEPSTPKEGPSQLQPNSRRSSASGNHAVRPRLPSSRPLSIEKSYIPGETDEDGLLRREYVLVDDTRAVEFNRAVDELDAVRRRPLQERQIPPSPSLEEYPSPVNNQNQNVTFPPPPSTGTAPPLSSSPSSMASRAASHALTRAINLASKKLFGTTQTQHQRKTSSPQSYSRPVSSPSSPRRPPILPLAAEERDPLEEELLMTLEELAQKTEVLTHWADEMYEYVKAVPQKPLPDPTKFLKREGEADKSARKRKHADMEAEYNAVTCVAVYMLLMSFSQKGIDKLRIYKEHMNMRYPDGDFVVSEGFDDALSWFKEHFMKCNDRAALVKTWLPAQYDGPKSWLDQLVYDRALLLSRTAARKELLDQANTPDECEKLYEESLWCLYALQDDLLQTGNPFMEEDQATIATWIKRTKLRLLRCRARMDMNDRDRLKDARADQNLADVARIPPPWDAKPSGKVSAT
ncbi:other/ULK/ULK protein kinase [Lentinula raphanica]|uniref:non-specific serine/threonine protein kinase n=1 Tax=Lentinula raphanica TaxID=153919 RepID=A0AA38UHB2_9AGAR|nr:other/ULK/ULK protein kinase [Lentinula raphanica]KAJ3841200.1 other/ULK/ULK protein kinase [Lentinula raphanica]